jgi:hypothetical protein
MWFTQTFKEDTYVFTLKRILREKHGKIEHLQMCFRSFTEENEIHDEMMTLEDLGLESVPVGNAETLEEKEMEEKSIPVHILYYDFKPADHSDPILLYFR